MPSFSGKETRHDLSSPADSGFGRPLPVGLDFTNRDNTRQTTTAARQTANALLKPAKVYSPSLCPARSRMLPVRTWKTATPRKGAGLRTPEVSPRRSAGVISRMTPQMVLIIPPITTPMTRKMTENPAMSRWPKTTMMATQQAV